MTALSAGCSTRQQPRSPAPGRSALRLVTYNVNYGIPGDGPTIRALAHARGDIVLLQETNPAWQDALTTALGARYPHSFFEHRGAAGGIAVMSALPIEDVEVLEPTAQGSWFPALRVVVRTDKGPLQLMGLHLRPQISNSGSVVSGYLFTPSVREAEVRGFAQQLDPKLATVVAGDFNESSSGSATDLLREQGFADVLAKFQPGADTWRWNTSLGEVSSGLDRVLVRGDGFMPINAQVMKAGRSDHLPVIVDFEL